MVGSLNMPKDGKLYHGEIMGFKYSKQFNSDAEFKAWLKPKLERYVLTTPEIEVLKDILGIA